jgi:cytosine/adenosine deaminase-related metal-dependent hydrolase
MRAMGVRGVMYQEVFGPDPDAADDAIASLESKIELHRSNESDRVRLGLSPHAPYTVSDQLFERVRDLARERRLPMAIHIAESAEEDAYVRNASGPFADAHRARGFAVAPRADTPVALLDRLGLLAQRPLLIHCVRSRDADIRAIADAHCAIAHCPVSNAKLGHGVAPLNEWLTAGVTVGLGSDSMASNNRMHLLEEARVALLAQRARGGAAVSLTPSTVLRLATLGSAECLGLAGEVGSIEVGKSADFAAFSLDDLPTVPDTDPIATAIFALGGARATTVAVAGDLRVIDGRLVDMDEGIVNRVRATSEALRASAVSRRDVQP